LIPKSSPPWLRLPRDRTVQLPGDTGPTRRRSVRRDDDVARLEFGDLVLAVPELGENRAVVLAPQRRCRHSAGGLGELHRGRGSSRSSVSPIAPISAPNSRSVGTARQTQLPPAASYSRSRALVP